MKNREIFVRDPVVTKILNDGVAAVTEGMSTKEIETLRYELEHFVCEGQYRDGLIRIIEAYIKNVDHPVQQAGWVSGFYGSGKSHLLKMLRHLWVDTKFPDGATARGLANLPEDVKDMLAELSTLGKRCNGLFASSGTLPSGGGRSVRLTILGIVFHSKGLPESYPQAKFCLWLKKMDISMQSEPRLRLPGGTFLVSFMTSTQARSLRKHSSRWTLPLRLRKSRPGRH